MHIPFNRPYLTGNEIDTMIKAARAGQISGNGLYTRKCQRLLEKTYGFRKTLLTTSCTDALEMAAILTRIGPGDEVIIPSFTFVSTANAFVLRGAKIVFADSGPLNPNIDTDKLEELITPRTRAIALVHYAGIACDMDRIMELARRHNLFVIEDAAHSIDSFHRGKALGSIGHFGTFSYHETKNIMSGEGGCLAINDKSFIERAEIIWEKGTNRVAFKRGEVSQYEWVDIGSSFLPSEVISAILYAQLRELKKIQKRRREIWHRYYQQLKPLAGQGKIGLPWLPDYATVNGHMFYITTDGLQERDRLLKYLARKNIHAVFHYIPLHSSPYYNDKHDGRELPVAQRYFETIIRLPFYYELEDQQVDHIAGVIARFYR
ncbi:MAG: dTDP-4-amino-4,6-dideoxygalactose transaminase [Bacteroidales bacterium]|jgi:dTDP-4-amino-4,6-dideoxygalactose transaminase